MPTCHVLSNQRFINYMYKMIMEIHAFLGHDFINSPAFTMLVYRTPCKSINKAIQYNQIDNVPERSALGMHETRTAN